VKAEAATLCVGLLASCLLASRISAWLVFEFEVGVSTIGVATLDICFPASCLVEFLGSSALWISCVGVATPIMAALVVGLHV
jgi:hypothetical protein